MKQKHKLITILLLTLASTLSLFTACEKDEDDNSPAFNYGSVTDIDGNEYRTIQIGDQEWMAENLKTSTFKDGTFIELLESNSDWTSNIKGYCWYDNDESTYADIYGALYTSYTVYTKKLCPAGWHVATDEEWSVLKTYIGSNGYNENEGDALKATFGWNDNGNGIDAYGFAALPGGRRYPDGLFQSVGSESIWWSGTEGETSPAYIWCIGSDSGLFSSWESRWAGHSVRCMKD